jgi:MFS family permease
MLAGTIGMCVCLFAMALAALTGHTEIWVLLFILGYMACFAMSIGPVTWVVIAEIFPTRTRAQAMGVATLCLWLADYVVTQTFPMMNDNQWLVETFKRSFPFLLYGGLCIVEILFIWRFVPETKGKSLEEIERMWVPK